MSYIKIHNIFFKVISLILLLSSLISVTNAAVLGTIYCHLDLATSTAGVGTSVELTAIIDSIRTVAGAPVLAATPCLQEYQTWRLHSTSGRPLGNLVVEVGDHCTGSPCYRDYYTHSSPFDLDRELVATACYFFVSDSLDSANAFLRSDHSFFIECYRPGNLQISLIEEYRTSTYDVWNVVSDTATLTITGPPMECPPLSAPQCGEIWGVTPIEAKGIWHHVILHEGYQYRVNTSPSPPASGFDLDTNYIELTSLVSETSYFLHVRGWCNCETAGRSYSPWTSIPFNTLPQPITTIKTSPQNLLFMAEGETYSTTTDFLWPYVGSGGPCHWIQAVSPQAYPPDGAIYYFREWSDGGAYGHCHSVGATNITITCYYDSLRGDFLLQSSPPASVCAGSIINVSVTMLNSGSIEWSAWDNIYLWSQNPPMNDIWGISEVPFEGSVVWPGEAHTFSFTVTAPDDPGDYIFQWQMGKGGVAFFGEPSEAINITVEAKPTATASNSGPYCQNEIVELFGGPDGMMSYIWSGPGGFTSTAQSPVRGSGTTSMTGTYRLIVQNSYGCLDTATTYVTVHAKPSASATNTGPYCGGQTIELTASPAGLTSYQWTGPRGFISDSRIATIPSADTSNAGRYSVIVSSSAGCLDTAWTDVTVYWKPEITAYTNTPVCEGSVLELRAEPPGMDSYFWHVPGGSIIPGRVIFRNPVSADMAGAYHVIATSSDGCSDTTWVLAIIDTVIKTLRIDSLTADSTFIFAGSVTGLHSFVSGAVDDVSYHWQPEAAIYDPDTSDPLVAPMTTTTFTVTVKDSQECGVYQVSDTIRIRVMTDFECMISIDSLTHDARICRGDSLQLYINAHFGMGTTSYTWSPNYNISSISVRNPIAYPETTTVYTAIAHDDSGCVDTGFVQINVSNVRMACTPDSGHICIGDGIELRVAPFGGTPPYSLAWLPVGSVIPLDSFSVYATPETTTSYRVIAVDSMGCYGLANITVRVDTPITTLYIELSADDSSLILGESTRLRAHAYSAGGTVGYSWSPSAIFDAPTSPTPWATPTSSGWLYVWVTDYQEYCRYSLLDSIYIDVDDTSSCPLRISHITPDTHICRGSSVILNVSVHGASGPVDYLWTPSSSLSDPHSANPIATPNHSTFYWVFVSDGECSDSAQVIVYVDTIRTTMRILNSAATFDTIDLGDSTLLYADITGVYGDLSVRWTPSASLGSPYSIETWAFPTEPTTYSIIAEDSQHCGVYRVTDSVHVHVNTWFGCSLSVIAFGADSICHGGSAHLDALESGASGGCHFEWTPHEGLSNPYLPNPTATPYITTTYTVTARDDSGCVAMDSITVWVKTIDISSLPDLHICDTDTVRLSLAMHAGVEPIDWVWSPPLFLSDPGSESPYCWPDSSISYSVIASDAEGCADTATIAIFVESMDFSMTLSLSSDTTIFYGGSAFLRAQVFGASGITRHSWSPTTWLDDPLSLTPTATPPVRTIYRFTAQDSQFCGIYTLTDSVIVDIMPDFDCSLTVSASFSETTICRGANVRLEAFVDGAFGEITYEWRPHGFLDDPYSPNPTSIGIDTTTVYTIEVNDDSCTAFANVVIYVPRIISLLDNSLTICIGDTIELWAEMFDAHEDLSYSWLPDYCLSNPDSAFTFAYPETSIQYTLTAVDDFGCSDSIVISIDIDTILTYMDISPIASPFVLNHGDSTLLNVVISDAVGDIYVEWTSDIGSVISPYNTTSWAIPESSGWFRIRVEDSQECGSYILFDSVFVHVRASYCSIGVYLDSPDSICRGDSTLLCANSSGANGSVNWQWRPIIGLTNPNSPSTYASPPVSTFYWAIATDSLGCADSNALTLVVRETPEAVAVAINETLFVAQRLELRGFPVDSSYKYFWSGPNGFSSENRIAIVENVELTHRGWFVLEVINLIGCAGTDSVFIEVFEQPLIPNIALTPLRMEFNIFEGETFDEARLKIANTGDSTLYISAISLIVNRDEFSLENISPIEIPPMAAESLMIRFTADLIGFYFDTIAVESNDPDSPIAKTVLQGRVHTPAEPDITAYPAILDFGAVNIDSCDIDSVYFVNNGGGLLIINSIQPTSASITFLRPPLPDTLFIGAGAFYLFEFCPVEIGSLRAWIDTESNDPDEAIFRLLALGLGVKYSGYSLSTEVITPNGDGLNDFVEFIIPDDVTYWIVEIYDHRGKQIISEKASRWDARRNGALVPIGTYYYRITSNGETRLSGAISVIY